MKFKMQLFSTQIHTNLNDFYFDVIKVKLIIIYKTFSTFPDKILLFIFEFSFHSSFILKPFPELLLHLMIDFTVIRCKFIRRMFPKQTYISNYFKLPGLDIFYPSSN